jgi:hypothetical protein
MNRQLFQYHPTVGYQYVPGLKARVDREGGAYLLRTNQAGFRCDHEFVTRKRSDTFRVLLFGDSYTAGDGVSNKQRYGDLLERLLPGVEVFNFGLSGTGTDQQYLIYRELGAGIEHDLVVIGVLVENIRRVAARYRPYLTPEGQPLILAKPYFVLEPDGSLTLAQVPVPREPIPPESLPPAERGHVDRGGNLAWLREFVNRLGPGVKEFAQRLSRYQPLPAYDRADDPHWQLLEAILRRWLGEVKVPVVICPVPLYQYVEQTADPSAYQARFATLAQPPHVLVHDPLPDFLAFPRSVRRGFRFGRDCHLTPAAHEVLARSLAGCIEPLLKARASGSR